MQSPSRRRFLAGLVALIGVGSSAAPAQPGPRIYRIGILGMARASDLSGPHPQSPTALAFVGEIRERGYVYGRHFVTEVRGADGKRDRLPGLAAELVSLNVDAIIAPGPALHALRQATSTIPIVMAASDDPVGSGAVQSLAHPVGNVTGLSLQSVDAVGKRLDLLNELVPALSRLAVLSDQGDTQLRPAAEAAAHARGWTALSYQVRDVGEIEKAFKAASTARSDGMLIGSGVVLYPQRRRVAELAASNRLPAVYGLRPQVEAGGLISFGADINDIWRRAATYVDKILKGAKPAELPVEQPTKFEVVVNLKTAKALGLVIPQSLLLRADDVIH